MTREEIRLRRMGLEARREELKKKEAELASQFKALQESECTHPNIQAYQTQDGYYEKCSDCGRVFLFHSSSNSVLQKR